MKQIINILRLLVAASLLTLQGCEQMGADIATALFYSRVKEVLPDGRVVTDWHDDEIYPKHIREIGHFDKEYCTWSGEVEIYVDIDDNPDKEDWWLFEKVTYKDGKRNGKRITYDGNGNINEVTYYKDDYLIKPPPDSNIWPHTSELEIDSKSTLDNTYPIITNHLRNRMPWLIDKLEIIGYPPEFLMNYVAEIEELLRDTSATQDNFDRSFNYGAWAIGGSDNYSAYKRFYSNYLDIVTSNSQETQKHNPLRLAVLKRHRTGSNSTFTVLQTSFPQYLLALRTLGAKISDVQVYTNRLDTYLNKFNTALNKIPITDPLFAIKVDQRLINALYILDNLYFESGNVTSALSNHATGIYNDANPLLDAARHAYFGDTLPVTIKTSGAGNVTGEGINCGTNDTDCKEYHDVNTTITLTAAPGTGAKFTGWSGDCTGTALTCTLKITQARQVIATFVGGGSPYNLSIRQIGDGYVKGSPSGIDCWGRCSADYAPGTVVTLTATPDDLSEFAGWGGSCSGTQSTCKLTMNGEKNVSATFRTIKPSFPLAVFRDGPGDVQDDAGSIDCGNDCTWQHPVDTQITLKAVPLSDARFVKWTGACKGTAETCVLTIKGETYVGAAFVSE